MRKNEVTCNGGFLDAIDWINSELERQDKEKVVIGFERDSKNPKKIRFFDKNNRTVWMPDNFYKKANIEIIKMGGLKADRFEHNRWKKIASGQCQDISLKGKLKESIKQIGLMIKKSIGLSK